jgi:hypothetical protein
MRTTGGEHPFHAPMMQRGDAAGNRDGQKAESGAHASQRPFTTQVHSAGNGDAGRHGAAICQLPPAESRMQAKSPDGGTGRGRLRVGRPRRSDPLLPSVLDRVRGSADDAGVQDPAWTV